MSKPKKRTYEVAETETISECLDRIAKDGYQPTRRMEKPIFQEVKNGSETIYEPIGRKIEFEARLVD